MVNMNSFTDMVLCSVCSKSFRDSWIERATSLWISYGHNPTIIADILSQQLTFGIRRIYTHLKLEDSYFDTPAPVELLLDVDVFSQE